MKVAIVGTGYVGLVSGTCFAETGNEVICADVDTAKIEMLRGGTIPIHEPGLDTLVERNVAAGRLSFTDNVPEAVALEEPGRYESPRSFDATIDFFKRAFRSTGGVRWRSVVNLPSIKAMHLQSVRKKSKWEGVNIYEHQGKVRYFVIPRPVTTKPKKASTQRR